MCAHFIMVQQFLCGLSRAKLSVNVTEVLKGLICLGKMLLYSFLKHLFKI